MLYLFDDFTTLIHNSELSIAKLYELISTHEESVTTKQCSGLLSLRNQEKLPTFY